MTNSYPDAASSAGRGPGAVSVCSWNGWDSLRHIIVGRATGTRVQAPEPAVIRDWPAHGFPAGTHGAMPRRMEEAANAQLDDLAAILAKRGIRVDRPTPIDFGQAVATPDWTHGSMFGCATPRDVLLVVGTQILEAPMSYRSRWFEYLCYRPLLQSYFDGDPNMRWQAAPKPRLTSASYQEDFWPQFERLSADRQIERVRCNDLILTEAEPLFDAADVARFGEDLFVQLSLATNRKGVDWLARHLPELRVHPVTFANTHPMHIDATWVALRPGLVLHCGEREAQPELERLFLINDWQIVTAPKPSRSPKDLPPLCFCTPWLAMNVLSLDPGTVCVEASEHGVAECLDRLGFEVIPVPFWDVAPFGGGLHCATLDIERAGTLHDYFPKRFGRFI